MFDANMRHLPKGLMFFASVHDIKPYTVLYKAGVRAGDFIFARMLDEENENPAIEVYLPTGKFMVRGEAHGLFGYWIVFEGCIENNKFQSFLDDTRKLKAELLYNDYLEYSRNY